MTKILILSLILFFSLPAFSEAAEVEAMLANAINQCEQIGSREYESGLIFNSDGYRSYYKRSACLQRAAVGFRERSLCSQVRRRFSLFASSWGYSRGNCQDLVDAELVKDQATLEALRQQYLSGPVRLLSITVERNGNGRDYDFIPKFADGFAHGYQMEFIVIDSGGNRHNLLTHGSYLTGSDNNLRLYLDRPTLLARFPSFAMGVSFDFEVHLLLSLGRGGPNNWMRDTTINDFFPASERTQVFTSEVTF